MQSWLAQTLIFLANRLQICALVISKLCKNYEFCLIPLSVSEKRPRPTLENFFELALTILIKIKEKGNSKLKKVPSNIDAFA